MQIQLGSVDYVLLILYFGFVLGIGYVLRKTVSGSKDFFESGRSLPAWICALGFIGANLGAQEVMGMAASGAKYGIMTSHFYWVGAIPAMVFVAIFMMPFYYGSKARSVPEYLKLRYDEKTRGFNAISFAFMTIMSSGISMFALAKLLNSILGWNFHACIVVSGIIVLAYIFMGGLTSAIYNEVLQFFLIVFGFLPLVLLGLQEVNGWEGLMGKLGTVATDAGFQEGAWARSWTCTGSAAANPMGVEWFGLAMGLGFVLSFGYWCTDFLVVQRAMAAKDMSAARRTPIIAAVPKMLFPVLVILPGMVAVGLHYGTEDTTYSIPVETKPLAEKIAAEKLGLLDRDLKQLAGAEKDELEAEKKRLVEELESREVSDSTAAARDKWTAELRADRKRLDYTMVIPTLLQHYLPTGLLGLCLTALMASFMSGMAGNVTAFNTVWTYDIYQSYIKKDGSDAHYLAVGRWTTVVGIGASMAAAYAAAKFNNIMDILQLVFAFVNAPLFATFLLGMFWRRATGHGAFFGLLSGTIAAAFHHGLTLPVGEEAGIKGGWMGANLHPYPSEMAQNFWTAIWAFTACFVATIVISVFTRQQRSEDQLKGLVYSLTPRPKEHGVAWYKQPVTLGLIVLVASALLNLLFW